MVEELAGAVVEKAVESSRMVVKCQTDTLIASRIEDRSDGEGGGRDERHIVNPGDLHARDT